MKTNYIIKLKRIEYDKANKLYRKILEQNKFIETETFIFKEMKSETLRKNYYKNNCQYLSKYKCITKNIYTKSIFKQ